MKTLKFKTNINCGGCIAKISPSLNSAKGIEKWSVDTVAPEKILSIETNNLTEAEVITIVTKAGYKAVSI